MNDNTRCDPCFGDVVTGRVGAKHSSDEFSSSVDIQSRMLRPYTSRPITSIRESLSPESVVSGTEHAVRVSLQRPVGVKHSFSGSSKNPGFYQLRWPVGAKHSSNESSSSCCIQSRMLRPYVWRNPPDRSIAVNLKELGYGG